MTFSIELYRGTRHWGCIGPVSKTTAKGIMAKKKAEAVEGRYELPVKKPSPLFSEMATQYLAYYQANRRPKSLRRDEMSYRALRPTFGRQCLADIPLWTLNSTNASGRKGVSAR